MEISSPEKWQWLLGVYVWLQQTPTLLRIMAAMALVSAGHWLWMQHNKVFKYELTHEIKLPLGYTAKGTQRVPIIAPRLSVVVQRIVHSPTKVQAVFSIDNSGNAFAEQIQCDLFENPSLLATQISQEDYRQERTFGRLGQRGTNLSFHFAEDPSKALHPGSQIKFASTMLKRTSAPFDMHYRILAQGIDQEGTVRVDPQELGRGT